MYNRLENEAKKKLRDNTRTYLKYTNRSLNLTAIFAVLGFVAAGATGLLLLQKEKITFDLSVLTAINFCLGIYNVWILPKLIVQRRELEKELFELEQSDLLEV